MGWYLRKSFRAGPVRWNLSKRGIGMSVGLRGLRVGTGPRGPYIAGGRGGVYFRQSLRSHRSKRSAARTPTATYTLAPPVAAPQRQAIPSVPPPPYPSGQPALDPSVPVHYIADAQLSPATPATQNALAQHIREQRAHLAIFPWMLAAVCFVDLFLLSGALGFASYGPLPALFGFILLALLAPMTAYPVIWAYQTDQARRFVVLNYELDAEESASYEQLCTGVSWLAYAALAQRVDAQYAHGDMKHFAGTTTALQMSPVTFVRPGQIPWLKTNIPVWGIRWGGGGSGLIFLPDHILFEQGSLIAVIPYSDVQLSSTNGRFVEYGMVPRDAHVASYTWQYLNKNGTPDRRYAANRQLPVLDVAYIGLDAPNSFQLLLQLSNLQSAEVFANTFRQFRPLVCPEPATPASPASLDVPGAQPPAPAPVTRPLPVSAP